MIIELYFTFFNLVLEYGDFQSMLILAFLTSILVFILATIAKFVLNKFKPWYFISFVVTQIYFLIAQTIFALWYKTPVPILLFFEPATYVYLIFAAPMIMAYRKIMKNWPVLPWHVIMYLLSLLASVVFWYFLIFHYTLFVLV